MSEEKMPLVQMLNISKSFGHVQALRKVDFTVNRQEVVGLLGDNGAGKTTLIKTLVGIYPPDTGEIYFEGKQVRFSSPREARAMGIETVHQDLALVDLMSISRNFFLGREPTRRIGFIELLDKRKMDQISEQVLEEIGIKVRLTNEKVSILSGGERQSISIGRAMHFGMKLLILDEPTSSLSIKEARKVLNYVTEAKRRGLSVIFITHNIYHVYPVADRFTILSHGLKVGDFDKEGTTPDDIAELIVGSTAT